jgi:nucleotide-binding universal stress UspA family protein
MSLQLMIAVDGSLESLQAVHKAIALVDAGLRAHIALVHVQQPASWLELATHDADDIATAAVEAGEHLMGAAMALLDAQGVGYTTEVVLGEPASVLVDMAQEVQADLVLIGARGMGAIESVLVGSVSKALVTRCTQPVLVVKMPEDPAQFVLGELGDNADAVDAP